MHSDWLGGAGPRGRRPRKWNQPCRTRKHESGRSVSMVTMSLRIVPRSQPSHRVHQGTPRGNSGKDPGEPRGVIRETGDGLSVCRDRARPGDCDRRLVRAWIRESDQCLVRARKRASPSARSTKAQGRIGRKGAATRLTATDFITDQYPEVERRRGAHPARGGHHESNLLTEAKGG